MAGHAAGHFDTYICRRDDGLRGRESDEVPLLLRAAFLEAGVEKEKIQVIPDEQEAVVTALNLAEAGDLVLIFGDDISRTWKQIIEFDASGQGAPSAAASSGPTPVKLPVRAEGVPFAAADLDNLIRDERGVRLARDADD